ncbi:Mannosyltransferase 1 [Trypanosoma melophagium]|uniref:Mannosyltransferase 1 n=1 Tax=Trypanosoma melophagium TaxID=715481 RepID=UPI00351A5A30|nr:Mannosyltransferase 1 [Trypanosoma melophagium]
MQSNSFVAAFLVKILLLILITTITITPPQQVVGDPFFYITEASQKYTEVENYIQKTLPLPANYTERTTFSVDFYNALQLLRIPRHGSSKLKFAETQVLLQPQGGGLHGTEARALLEDKSDDAIIDEIFAMPLPTQSNGNNTQLSETNTNNTNNNHNHNNSTTTAAATHSIGRSLLEFALEHLFYRNQTVIVSPTTKPRKYDLPRQMAKRPPTHGWRRFYIAINLYNNEATIPFLTGALVAFIEDELGPFFDISTSVVVSIFTNESKDRTALLVKRLLIPRLQRAGVRNIFATVAGTCYTYDKVPKWMPRIEWMSCVRNKALEPLYNWGMQLFSPAFYASSWECEKNNNCTSVNAFLNEMRPLRRYKMSTNGNASNNVKNFTSIHNNDHNNNGTKKNDDNNNINNINNNNNNNNNSRGSAGFPPWEIVHDDPDGDNMVVLFFNDIFFRPQDITTLLESVEEPLIAARRESHGVMEEDAPTHSALKEKHKGIGTTFDMACGMDFYYSFYDRWVSRDRFGKPFTGYMPYTDEPETQAAFSRIIAHTGSVYGRKQAIPVKCCWNGVAAIRGRLFLSPLRGMKRNVGDTESTLHKEWQKQQEQKGEREVGKKRENFTVEMDGIAHTLEDEIQLWKGQKYRYDPEAHKQVINLYYLILLKRLSLRRERWAYNVSKFSKDTRLYLPLYNIPLSASAIRAKYGIELSTSVKDSLITSGIAEEEIGNSVYYRAVEPGIRFRHALLPSFGATVEGRHTVQDDVCVSSECLLICQDILHAALLEGRAPVILMNPNVRVAYESAHFDRITGWFYNSYVVFALFSWLRYFFLLFYSSFGHWESSSEAGIPTSAADDWTAGNYNRTAVIGHTYPGGVTRSRLVNITRASLMVCHVPEETVLSSFIRFATLGFFLIVCLHVCQKCVRHVLQYCAFVWRSLMYSKCFYAMLRIRWYLMRALLHPRGKIAFGCPRCITRVIRWILHSRLLHCCTSCETPEEGEVFLL